MENNPEVPPEFYGKWWKIINEEFGEIVQEKENEEWVRSITVEAYARGIKHLNINL